MTSLQHNKSVKKAKGIGPASQKHRNWGFMIMWEFQVREGMEKRFEEVYGTQGDWARFFRQDTSYVGTELIHNFKVERSYVTLDFWTSQKAYDAFRKGHLARYKAIDQKCEQMIESEREIGRFVRVPSRSNSKRRSA